MESNVTGRDLFVVTVMAFGFGALFAWAIIDPPVASKVASTAAAMKNSGSAQPSEWPAWVQAIGSVAGICAAVWVAWWQQVNARRDQKIRDRNEEISRYVRANRILQRFEECIRAGLSKSRAALDPGQSVPLTLAIIPNELWELEREFHLMPGSAGPSFTAIDFYRQAQHIISSGELVHSDQARFNRKLGFAEAELSRALKAIIDFLTKLD